MRCSRQRYYRHSQIAVLPLELPARPKTPLDTPTVPPGTCLVLPLENQLEAERYYRWSSGTTASTCFVLPLELQVKAERYYRCGSGTTASTVISRAEAHVMAHNLPLRPLDYKYSSSA